MLRNLLLTACVMLPLTAAVSGQELLPIGMLPALDPEWEVQDDEKAVKPDSGLPFHWIVFRNKKTGDLLSFAARPPETGNKRSMEYWSDTALEIFPNGLPVWTQASNDPTNNATNNATNNVLSIEASRSENHELLEYCFVTETSGRKNTMSQGRVCVFGKAIVFVQHTSTSPITSEIVEDTISKLIRNQQDGTVPKSQ